MAGYDSITDYIDILLAVSRLSYDNNIALIDYGESRLLLVSLSVEKHCRFR